MSNFESLGLVNAGLPGTAPQLFTASTVDDLATITAVGYLNDQAVRIKAGDFFFINYSDTSVFPLDTGQASSTARFQVSYSAPNWSLVQTDVSGFLLASNNLSDVANAATSLTNLGLGSGNNVAFLNVQAGNSGNAGYLRSYPATAAEGYFEIQAVNSAGNYAAILSNHSLGQATTWTLPDPGASTANILLDAGTGAAISVNKLSYGATPVSQVDPGSCTISAAAGAANTATVTIQLKDGAGNNIAYISPFRVYASSASNGLTLASAASTGFSVASGGLSLANGTAVTTQINGVTSATGGCVLSLLDTGKQTSYLVLVLHNGIKISAQLSAGSYG